MSEPTPQHDPTPPRVDGACDSREHSQRPSAAPLILASTSPRRSALMKEHGFDVTVVAPPWDEPEWIGSQLPPPQRAEALSYFKARSVADRLVCDALALDGLAFGGLALSANTPSLPEGVSPPPHDRRVRCADLASLPPPPCEGVSVPPLSREGARVPPLPCAVVPLPPLPPRERGRGEGSWDARFATVRILAGDTVVALGNRVFGKPTDREDARAILTALSGTTHHVITGVTLLDVAPRDSTGNSVDEVPLHDTATDSGCPILAPARVGDGSTDAPGASLLRWPGAPSSLRRGWGTDGPRRLIRHDTTAVTMRRLTDAELEAYLDTGDWEGKAGAYGIQDIGDAFITRIEGSFTNVVGFPLELILQMLAA